MEETKGTTYKWLTLLTASIGTFMATLDTSIVNIAFPRLTEVFNTEPSVVLWVTVAYLLVSTGLMLILGRIADAFGRKKLYLLGYFLFSIGLILCPFSQSIVQLILFRVIQAVGAAMIVPVSTAIVTATFPDKERGRALGIVATVISAGLLAGPVLGGFLLDALGWESIFYTRVPVGIIGLVIAWIILKEQRGSDISIKFDFRGAATLFGGVTCLILFFNLGGRLGFLSLPVLILISSAIILLVLFIVLERKAEQPVVDLSLFRNRDFAGGNISISIAALAAASQVLILPFYLINGLGFSTSDSGLLLATSFLSSGILAPISGWLSDKTSPRILCTVGITLICMALYLFSTLGPESSRVDIVFRLVVLGMGWGIFVSPNLSSVMGSVPRDRLSTASAMISTTRQIGMSCGIAIAGAIFTNRQLFHATQLAHDNLDPLILDRLSLIAAFQDTLLIAAIICSIGMFASLIRRKKEPK